MLYSLSCPVLTNTVGTVPKVNSKILERDKINTPSTQTHDCTHGLGGSMS